MSTTTFETRRPPRSGREVREALCAAADRPIVTFTPWMLDGLPEPAHRWLDHAIKPGAPLARHARLRMHGQIRLGRHWHDFTATEDLVPEVGFVWSARTRIGGVPVTGFDGYVDGRGTMRWSILEVPIVRRSDADTTRSAIDRLAAESVLLPSGLLDADWRHTAETDSASYTRGVDGRFARSPVRIHAAAGGRLLGVSMQRWGSPVGGDYDLQPFVVTFDREYDAGALLVPDGIHASWPRAGGEFFRASLDSVTLS